ncbi:14199_t:CDS:2 [Funneliformis geosporum]|uniref:14199_t:CDS:1 n=1 Tax=Funneliformis geosporum TaxID=1117311 RepID=A0A9W4WTF9_9GLOM|nr:14199_t:CDS:2 [Funneliformis geosporum]
MINYNLYDIIQNQPLTDDYDRYIVNEGNGIDSLDVISRRLNHHARSIIKFKAVFEGILISPKVLPELVNLRELELSVINLSQRYEEQLKLSTFSNLQVLNIRNISVKTMANIIEKTNGHVRKIWVDDYKLCNDSERLIRAIYKNCSYIEELSIALYNHNFMEFEKLLQRCGHLKTLYIKVLSTKENESEDRMILSEILKEYAPACLNNIT